MNPDLYRDKALDEGRDSAASTPTLAPSLLPISSVEEKQLVFRFDLRYIEEEDWLEIKLGRIKGMGAAVTEAGKPFDEIQIR